MTQWFVPPIVIPGAIVAYFAALVLYRHFVVPEIKANPTRKNCLPSSRSKKVTGLSLKTGRATTAWI